MKIDKDFLTAWLSDFIAITAQVSGEPLSLAINIGRVTVFCPVDIFAVLIGQRVLIEGTAGHFFPHSGQYGDVLIQVKPDKALSIQIKVSKNGE